MGSPHPVTIQLQIQSQKGQEGNQEGRAWVFTSFPLARILNPTLYEDETSLDFLPTS